MDNQNESPSEVKKLLFFPIILMTTPGAAQVADPTQFTNAAVQIAEVIGQDGGARTVWESASPLMKAATSRDEFSQIVAQRQQINGIVQGREWFSVSRTQIGSDNQNVPAGNYVTVIFQSVDNNQFLISEVITYHLGDDGAWRLAGYSIE